jgi:hypothetical protein
MAQTHPNAFMHQAQEKREQAARLIAEAEQLEAKASELRGEKPVQKPEEPSNTSTAEPESEPEVAEQPSVEEVPSDVASSEDVHKRNRRR